MQHRIRFQNLVEVQQFALIHPMTYEIIEVVLKYLPDSTPLCFNEIARGPSSPDWKPESWHCQPPPFRAVDFDLDFLPQSADARLLANVNAYFQYDPTRPEKQVAIIHDPRHLHVQSHPNTVRKR